MCRLPGLVTIAGAKHPIPSRTRKLSALALMVLRLKTWESKSSPDLINDTQTNLSLNDKSQVIIAGWSSPVARQAHNLKAAGSNPAPATNKPPAKMLGGLFVSKNNITKITGLILLYLKHKR